MSVRATELRKGMVIQKDGDLLLITEYHHHTPGNLRAIIQVKTRSLSSGSSSAMRLGSGDTVDVAYLEKRKCEYLYREADGNFVFMDMSSYEQVPLSAELVGEKMGYLRENTQVEVTFHENQALDVELPVQVVLKVTSAEPAVKGNTATNVKKEAVVETGMTVKVPMHISAGDEIKIRTTDGEFQGRVNA